MSDNGMQTVSSDLRKFRETIMVEHVTNAPYHPRSNRKAESFVDMFKRALKNSNKEVMDVVLQPFLRVESTV